MRSTKASTKKSARPPARLDLSVQYAIDAAGLPTRALLRKWARAALPGAARVTLRFVGEAEGRALNAAYRGKDYATNVLSFPYEPAPRLAGDVALCVPVVMREAAEQAKAPEAHFAHLVVHGMLHLQGYDHDGDADAQAMEEKEREILAHLGFPDPYLNTVA